MFQHKINNNKHYKKQIRKGFKQLCTAFKWLFIILLLLFLLWFMLDLLQDNNLLIQRVNQQDDQLTNMRLQLQESYSTNAELNQQLNYAHIELDLAQDRIDELVNDRLTQQQPKVYINEQPIEIPTAQTEAKPNFQPLDGINMIPVTIVGILTMAKGIFSLLPAIP